MINCMCHVVTLCAQGKGRDNHYKQTHRLDSTMFFIRRYVEFQTCTKMTLLNGELQKYIIITFLIIFIEKLTIAL